MRTQKSWSKQVNREDAQNLMESYLKPIFGFALKRCRNIQDAEDLSQEILLNAFRGLLKREDLRNPDKYIWTVAHNALSNYYRDHATKNLMGISIEEFAEVIADPDSDSEAEDEIRRNRKALDRLKEEIAYLSKLQRRIVIAYYFENRKQADIACELGIPVGTVKWHLFEAKKELKRGMDTMRKTSDLKFNPIKFDAVGVMGHIGTKSPDEFFRSALAQNLCYCVRNKAKTVAEIADDLGVSPVYVENEAEFLEEFGFLTEEKGRYLVNFIISEFTEEILLLKDHMYKRAAELVANDLYDELTACGILDNPEILCGQSDEPVTLTSDPHRDRNFLLWALIPYIIACSGDRLAEEHISFDEVATIRPDGGKNIFHTTVGADSLNLPEDYVCMRNWSGPMWNENGKYTLWQVDSEWSDKRLVDLRYSEDAKRVLALFETESEDPPLSKEDYVWLTERGYVKTNGDFEGLFRSSWQPVILNGKEIRDKLLAVGDRIKEKHWAELQALSEPYAETVLNTVPAHLKKVKAYELQSLFRSDGWFLLHCIVTLLKNGKLKEPTKGQKKILTTLILKA